MRNLLTPQLNAAKLQFIWLGSARGVKISQILQIFHDTYHDKIRNLYKGPHKHNLYKVTNYWD